MPFLYNFKSRQLYSIINYILSEGENTLLNSIKKKLILGFSIIIIIIAVGTSINVYSFMSDKDHLTHIQDKAVKSVDITNNMKNDIIQTRLYLTDVGASKKQDDLKKAEDHAAAFKKNVEELSNLEPDLPDLKNDLKDLNVSFDEFYSTGKDMSGMYLNNDTEGGNNLMDKFDKIADEVYKKVENIHHESQNDMNMDLATIKEHMSMNVEMSIAATVISVVLSIVIALILGNGIKKPINSLLEIFIELEKGEGDLTKRINLKSKDEIGQMAQAFNKFMASMENMVISIKQNSNIVSDGAKSLSSGGVNATEEITQINDHMIKVTQDTQSITESIEQITTSISEIAQTSQSTAEDAQDIGGTAEEVNNLAEESQRYSLNVKNEMEKVQMISSNTIEITQKLGNEANEIGKIIDTIKAITAQTNLLALNASIEAARAGEHGLGFGVVASEIRKLAENNDESTKMIEEIILNIQQMINQTIEATANVGNNINKGTKMVETVYEQLQKIADGVGQINERIQSIATSTEEQGASTEELSSVMDNINASNSQITAAVQQIASSISIETDTITELGSVASELSDSSSKLEGLVNKFKIRT